MFIACGNVDQGVSAVPVVCSGIPESGNPSAGPRVDSDTTDRIEEQKVISRPGFLPGIVTLVTITVIGIGISPSVAEAQARGTMQVYATVLESQSGLQVLSAAREAVSSTGNPSAARRPVDAPTVARISVRRDRRLVVVTIDYLRN